MASITEADFQGRLAASGITPEEPLHSVLTTIYQTATEAREIVGTGARGLSPAGEKELIVRVAESAADAAQHEVERLARRIGWKNAGLMAVSGLTLLGGGYVWGGHHQPGFLERLAALNDETALARYCEGHSLARDGGTACQLPSVWVRRKEE